MASPLSCQGFASKRRLNGPAGLFLTFGVGGSPSSSSIVRDYWLGVHVLLLSESPETATVLIAAEGMQPCLSNSTSTHANDSICSRVTSRPLEQRREAAVSISTAQGRNGQCRALGPDKLSFDCETDTARGVEGSTCKTSHVFPSSLSDKISRCTYPSFLGPYHPYERIGGTLACQVK